jgi:hypothetical protein
MLTRKDLEKTLATHPLVQPRLETLRLAEEINPAFHKPHIMGGYLRNIVLGKEPKDCDVFFQGQQLNQPGIIEAVREAEQRLGIEPFPEWDFENLLATGPSDDFYANAIGIHAMHTDYLTILLMDSHGHLYIGDEEKSLSDFTNRVYDLRFLGIEVWANHRGQGRSYGSCLIGDLTRAIYLAKVLDLSHSAIVNYLLRNFDTFFNQLDENDQTARSMYWEKKSGRDSSYQPMLDFYGITALTTN